jgi:hypothetical protein
LPKQPSRLGHGARPKRSGTRQSTKVLPFRPRNLVERSDESRGAGSWGPDHDRPPLVASNFDDRVAHGNLLGVFNLYVPHWHCTLLRCALMRWGPEGERVILPDCSWRTARGAWTHRPNFLFDSDEEMRAFEEAALVAVRIARRNPPPPQPVASTWTSAPPSTAAESAGDDGVARADHDDVPF